MWVLRFYRTGDMKIAENTDIIVRWLKKKFNAISTESIGGVLYVKKEGLSIGYMRIVEVLND